MKQSWIAILLASIMMLTACGETGGREVILPSGNQPSEQTDLDDSSLTALRTEIASHDALFGVAYLGYAELPHWADICVYLEAHGLTDSFPFLSALREDHAVLQEGGEIYAVVPGKDVSLTISEFGMDEDDDIPHRGKDLLRVTDGIPLLLRGNISEIVPNLLITAEHGSQSLEYSPCLSGMDGSLVTEAGVYDFTPYDRLVASYPGYDQLPDPVFTLNTWYTQHHDGAGNLLAMTLSIHPDGTMEYSYGQPYSHISERFEGTWREAHSGGMEGEPHLVLEMVGGPVDELGRPVPSKQYERTCEVIWEIQSTLVLRHAGGAPLLPGTEENSYTFLPFDGVHMVNTWTTHAEYWGWYYDLQLLENTQCCLSIGEIGGGPLAQYKGWWSLLEDNTLSLNLMLRSGQHPESPEVEQIGGQYLVENWTPTSMTLTYRSGMILTPEMEETTHASFWK